MAILIRTAFSSAIRTSWHICLLCGIAQAVEVTPILPVPESTNANSTPTLKAQIERLEDETSTISFLYRKTSPPIRSNFTIIALPDTQNYTASRLGGLPEMFTAQTDWIATNRLSRNIVFACELGDCVHNLDYNESEWLVATNALYRLENPATTKLLFGIPYGIAPGNHDGPRFYNKYFGISHFGGRPYYGGHYSTNNNNSFVLFSASGMDFIAVLLEYAPSQQILAWASQILNNYFDRRAIIVSHSILHPGTNLIFNAQGLPIYEALKGQKNIFLMLCGHEPQIGTRTDWFEGRPITTVLSDYENEMNGGNGWMRIMEFVPSNNVINVKTYSPWLNQFKSAPHQFSIAYDMSPAQFAVADSVSTNGTSVLLESRRLLDLLPDTSYEWRVNVQNGSTNYTSESWRFMTASTNATESHLKIVGFSTDASGRSSFSWVSHGQKRYRVEYLDGAQGGRFTGQFVEIIRPVLEETETVPEGSTSVQVFIDDFTLTGGPPTYGSRFFRVKEMP